MVIASVELDWLVAFVDLLVVLSVLLDVTVISPLLFVKAVASVINGSSVVTFVEE